MINNAVFFEELETKLSDLERKKLPENLKLTITYVTGEKECFNVTEAFWVSSLLATKKRLKYIYYKHNLINLDHVVKMHYEQVQ